jgi:hypothetical protein
MTEATAPTAFFAAVGFPCGQVHLEDDDGYLVSVGGELQPLDSWHYAIWLAHGSSWTDDSQQFLHDHAHHEAYLSGREKLLQLGLLVTLSGDPSQDFAALNDLSLRLLCTGLGALQGDENEMYFSAPNGSMVRLDPFSYLLILRANTSTSLADTCAAAALGLGLERLEVATVLLVALPPLLGTQCAVLDRVAQ